MSLTPYKRFSRSCTSAEGRASMRSTAKQSLRLWPSRRRSSVRSKGKRRPLYRPSNKVAQTFAALWNPWAVCQTRSRAASGSCADVFMLPSAHPARGGPQLRGDLFSLFGRHHVNGRERTTPGIQLHAGRHIGQAALERGHLQQALLCGLLMGAQDRPVGHGAAKRLGAWRGARGLDGGDGHDFSFLQGEQVPQGLRTGTAGAKQQEGGGRLGLSRGSGPARTSRAWSAG